MLWNSFSYKLRDVDLHKNEDAHKRYEYNKSLVQIWEFLYENLRKMSAL